MAERHAEIAEALRRRVLRGLHAGTLWQGDRLPSARELEAEFDTDHRVILDAYRELVDEGLVELRPRGGIYVKSRGVNEAGFPPLPVPWMIDVLADGLSREIPAPELHEWLRLCTETLRLRAVVISSTLDQVDGLCRELRDDFGLDAEGFTADAVRGAEPVPVSVRRADLLVTTEAHEDWGRRLADDFHKALLVVKVRPDLHVGEWALLLRRPVYVVAATSEFGEMLRRFFADVPGVRENLHVLVFDRDDLSTIPDNAPTYITQHVRHKLTGVRIPGRILPAARTIASESAREIFAFIVRSNVDALSRRGR